MITNDPSPPPSQPTIDPDSIQTLSFNQTTISQANPGRDVLIAFLVWVGSVALLLIIPVIAVIPYIIKLAMEGNSLDPVQLGRDKTFLFLSILAVIPAHLLTLLGIWLVIKRWWKTSFSQTLKFTWPPSWVPWMGVAVCFVVAVLLLGLGSVVVKLLGGGKTDLDLLIESSFQTRVATAFLAVATAPLVEEIVYRGMLYPAIQRLLGRGWSVVVVTVMFAVVHVPQYRNNIGVIIVITVLSVVLTLVRAWSDSLLPSVIIHLIFNGLQSLYLVLEPFIEKSEKLEPTQTVIILLKAIRYLF